MRLRRQFSLVLVLGLLLLLRMGPPARSADQPPEAAARPVDGKAEGAANPEVAVGSHADGHGGESTYQKEIRPFLAKHCFACHANGKAKGDLSFDKFMDDMSVFNDRKLWDDVQQMVQSHEMPPNKRPKPDPAEVEAVLKSIHGLFDHFDQNAKPNVGRVTIRRLNRTEYNNTIRDLVGVDFKPADDFPADDVGYGFDNIGDVLSVTPLLLEKYLNAAEQVLDQAIVVMDPPKPTRSQIGAIRANAASTSFEMGGTIAFDEGDYVIRCRVYADQVGDDSARAMIRAAGKDVKEFAVKATTQPRAETIEARVRMKPGTSRVGVMLTNPFSLPDPTAKPTTQPATQPATRPANGFGRGFGGGRGFVPPVNDGRTRILHLQGIEVEGPFDPPPPQLPEAHRRLMAHADGLAPREAAREIVTRFATGAFRRPVRPVEVEPCLRMFDVAERQGKRFELCVRAALYRVLLSPHFLFRIELDPPGAKEGTAYPIGEYELASRLSYFFWNSMPDAELFALAGKGQLRANLDAQVRRMVQDPKSSSFVQTFAEQWLALRKLDLASPDPKLFPNFDNNLRQAMIRESDLFFEAIVREDRPVLDLLDADFTFVNEQLAKHYGIEGVKGKKFVRVKVPPTRGGILTQASVLTLTSNATRTSPVKRGKFVLDQILNTPPPPPPDNVPALEEQKQLTGTLRQVMEQHRANAVCASCHQRMDPIGFAFENFDPTGAWRDKDGAADIDASGVLPDGKAFSGPGGLKQILLKGKRDLFVRCVVEKMLTYAMGRGLEYYDRRAVGQIMAALAKDDYRFSRLLTEIVKSDPFQMRTATGESQ